MNAADLMTMSPADLAALELELQARVAKGEAATREYSQCGAEAVGVLRALDEEGLIPESARDIVLDVLTRWRAAVDAGKAAAAMKG